MSCYVVLLFSIFSLSYFLSSFLSSLLPAFCSRPTRAAPGGYLTPNWSQPATHHTYDGLGRITQVTHTDGAVVVTSYDGWTRSVVDENGHRRSDDTDAFGQLAQVREYSGTVPAVSLYATTNYAYDVLGSLTAITDTVGITTTMTYDPLGRKTAMHDPDMFSIINRYTPVALLALFSIIIWPTFRLTKTLFTLDRIGGRWYFVGLGQQPSPPGWAQDEPPFTPGVP